MKSRIKNKIKVGNRANKMKHLANPFRFFNISIKNEPIKLFGKGRESLEGDCLNLLSITFKWTNQINYCLFTQ